MVQSLRTRLRTRLPGQMDSVRLFLAALLVGGLLLFAAGVTVAYQIRHTIALGTHLSRLVDISEELDTLLIYLLDAETGQRGYLLTDDPAYLAPYNQATAQIADLLATLEAQAADDPELAAILAQIQDLSREKVDELAQTVTLWQAGRSDQALALVHSGQGRETMDTLRQHIARAKARIEARRSQMTQEVMVISRRSSLVLTAVPLLALLLLLVSGLAFRAELARQRRLIQALAHARDQAQAASRAKTAFLATMSHELRTPLNAILGFAELLDRPEMVALDARQRRYLAHIREAGQRLLRQVNLLLDVAELESGRLQVRPVPLAVATAVTHVVERLRPLAESREIRIEVRVPRDLPPILADETRLHQILHQLLDNALHFTPPGGRVEIGARVEASESRDTEPSELVLWVRDTGVGLATEHLESIFQDFVQVDQGYGRSREGAGLGLGLARRLAQLHGGRVWAESPGPGQGSTFWLRWPLPHLAATGTMDAPADSPPPRPFALVVEDDPATAELLAERLQEHGVATLHANAAVQGVHLARALRPDLILLDIHLPEALHGWQALITLKSLDETRDIPVVVVSVSDERARGLALGAAEWLVKPVASEELTQILDEIGRPARKRPDGTRRSN